MTRYISTFPALPLTWECTVVWEARDPTTDAQVSGVVINNPVLYGLNLTSQAGNAPAVAAVGALWTPIPATDTEEAAATPPPDLEGVAAGAEAGAQEGSG
jgi:hypothetical protein